MSSKFYPSRRVAFKLFINLSIWGSAVFGLIIFAAGRLHGDSFASIAAMSFIGVSLLAIVIAVAIAIAYLGERSRDGRICGRNIELHYEKGSKVIDMSHATNVAYRFGTMLIGRGCQRDLIYFVNPELAEEIKDAWRREREGRG